MSVSAPVTTRADLRSDGPATDSPDRWVSRPVLAWLLRFTVLALPVAAAVGASLAVEMSVSRPQGWTQLWWWSATLLVSAVTAAVVERGVRRLTPLATLLRLTLLFPDRAPSRFKVARTAANPARLGELALGVDDRSDAAAQVLALMAQLGRHDRLTRGHSERVRVFSDLIAEQLGVHGDDRDKLRWGALVHDIGKMSVPAAVLNKKGRPDPVEWAQIQGHPAAGEAYAGPLFGWLGPWAGAITEHHERWDGAGYPQRIGGDDLTLGGRIVAVADAYETMTAARSYKKALSVEAARRELTVCAGHQFDPEVVRAFLLIGVGRLSRALGPLAWLAQLPFALHLQAAAARLTTAAGAAGPAAAVGVGGFAAVAATLTGAMPTAAATPPIVQVATAHVRPAALRVVTALPPPRVDAAPPPPAAVSAQRSSVDPPTAPPGGPIDDTLFAALNRLTPLPPTAGDTAASAGTPPRSAPAPAGQPGSTVGPPTLAAPSGHPVTAAPTSSSSGAAATPPAGHPASGSPGPVTSSPVAGSPVASSPAPSPAVPASPSASAVPSSASVAPSPTPRPATPQASSPQPTPTSSRTKPPRGDGRGDGGGGGDGRGGDGRGDG